MPYILMKILIRDHVLLIQCLLHPLFFCICHCSLYYKSITPCYICFSFVTTQVQKPESVIALVRRLLYVYCELKRKIFYDLCHPLFTVDAEYMLHKLKNGFQFIAELSLIYYRIAVVCLIYG